MRYFRKSAKYIVVFLMVFMVSTIATGRQINLADTASVATETIDNRKTIYLLGDSIMATTPKRFYPRTGWGAVLYKYLKGAEDVVITNLELENNPNATRYELPNVIIENHAKPTESSKTLIEKGVYQNLLDRVKEGDYVIISVGHNDSRQDWTSKATTPEEYFQNLNTFVEGFKAKGAVCVLVSSIPRYGFTMRHECLNFFAAYRAEMSRLAMFKDITYISMGESLEGHFTRIGKAETQKYYMILEPGVYEKYKNGSKDRTHLTEYGAEQIAKKFLRMIVTEEGMEDFDNWINREVIYD